jgi:hypothetical protein
MISFLGLCVLILLVVVFLVLLILSIFNKFLPKWVCTKMGWHLAPEKTGFDGASLNGTCPRCDKHVLQDSQGNWF